MRADRVRLPLDVLKNDDGSGLKPAQIAIFRQFSLLVVQPSCVRQQIDIIRGVAWTTYLTIADLMNYTCWCGGIVGQNIGCL